VTCGGGSCNVTCEAGGHATCTGTGCSVPSC
jgi:hypothetical protein